MGSVRKSISSLLTAARGLARGLWTPEGTVAEKAVRATVWNFASMVSRRGLGLVQLMVMARLLAPKDFGTLAICAVVIEFFDLLTDLGLNLPIIQRKEINDEVLDTAWTISLCRNLLLLLVTFCVAAPIARFYKDPLLSPVMKVLALRYLVGAFANIGTTLWRREMNFRLDVVCDIVPRVIAVGVTITLGVLMKNVWALVYGQLVQSAASLAAGYLLHPYRPRLRWRWEHVREFLHFGVNITAAGVIFHLATTADQLVLGKLAGEDLLGLFVVPLTLSKLAALWLAGTLTYAAMPTYAKFQGDRERLGQSYAAVLKFIFILALPATAGMCLLAPGIIRLAYGVKYLPAVPCFRLLVLVGLVTAVGETVLPLLLAVGRPRPYLIFHAVRLTLLAAVICPLVSRANIVGAACSQLLAVTGSGLWGLWVAREIVGMESLRDAYECLRGVAVSVLIMSAAVGLPILAGVTGRPAGLALTVGLGALVYVGALCVVSPGTVQEALRIASKARTRAEPEPSRAD